VFVQDIVTGALTSYFVNSAIVAESPEDVDPLVLACLLFLDLLRLIGARCAAGAVNAGLSDAMRSVSKSSIVNINLQRIESGPKHLQNNIG
jgi:hypothetical protein